LDSLHRRGRRLQIAAQIPDLFQHALHCFRVCRSSLRWSLQLSSRHASSRLANTHKRDGHQNSLSHLHTSTQSQSDFAESPASSAAFVLSFLRWRAWILGAAGAQKVPGFAVAKSAPFRRNRPKMVSKYFPPPVEILASPASW
jgi:hypothetical protein